MNIFPNKLSLDQLLNSMGEVSGVLGNRDISISEASPIHNAKDNSITFCNKRDKDGLVAISNSKARIIICYDDLQFALDDYADKTLILVSNPRLAFTRVMRKYFEKKPEFGVSSTAVIEKGAEIHPDVFIGPYCVIGKCKIGEGTIIYGNSFVYSGSIIGKNVVIQAGAVIGAEAAGFDRNAKQELERFPQVGGVIIEDNVEIGANTGIMRGALEYTVIGQGTKIGNLCYIGHNVIIGRHCLILHQSAIGGSCWIGDYCQISLGARVRNKIRIGSNSLVGMGAVVIKNIDSGKVVFGVPAKEQSKI